MTATNSAQPARNPFARLYDALVDPVAPLFGAPNTVIKGRHPRCHSDGDNWPTCEEEACRFSRV